MQNGAPLNTLNATGAGKIEHIVYVVQENRSFDNLFQGYPGADTVASGKDSLGHTIRLQPASLSDQYDIDHSAAAMFAACNGNGTLRGTHCTMSGFNNEEYFGGPPGIKLPMYVYVPHRSRNRISIWRTSGSWPTGCSNPISMRASLATSTS